MFIAELFDNRSILVCYPGRFQPFHKGHKFAYDYLVKNFGQESVFIVTSNVVAPPKSPLNFNEKLGLMTLTGVDASRIVQTQSPYRAVELVSKYDPENTALVFGISEKDMAEDPRFKFGVKKDGSPTYFQPFNRSKLQPLSKHGYVVTVPTLDFNVMGKPMRSASEFRHRFANSNMQVRKKMFVDMFGKFDAKCFNLLCNKIIEGFENQDVILEDLDNYKYTIPRNNTL